MDNEFSEAEIRAWQEGKDKRASLPVLSKKDIRKFVSFVAENRGSGDFEVYLGLSSNEVERLKLKLNLNTPEEAQGMLKDVFDFDDRVQALNVEAERTLAKQKQVEAQRRLDEFEERRKETILKRQKAIKEAIDVLSIKKEDQARQKRLEKTINQNNDKLESTWQLPPEYDGDQLETLLISRGWNFTCTMFNVLPVQIKAELARLGRANKINWDLVPR